MLPLRVVDSRHCRHDLKGIGKLKPKHLSDGWTASETLSPIFVQQPNCGLNLTICATSWKPTIRLTSHSDWPICGGYRIYRVWTFLIKSSFLFFHCLHNYFFHFRCLKPTGTLWMPSRKTILPPKNAFTLLMYLLQPAWRCNSPLHMQ